MPLPSARVIINSGMPPIVPSTMLGNPKQDYRPRVRCSNMYKKRIDKSACMGPVPPPYNPRIAMVRTMHLRSNNNSSSINLMRIQHRHRRHQPPGDWRPYHYYVLRPVNNGYRICVGYKVRRITMRGGNVRNHFWHHHSRFWRYRNMYCCILRPVLKRYRYM